MKRLSEYTKSSKQLTVLTGVAFMWLLILTLLFLSHMNRLSAMSLSQKDSDLEARIMALQIDFADQFTEIAQNVEHAQAATRSGMQALSQSFDEQLNKFQTRLRNNQPDLSEVFRRLDRLGEDVASLTKAQQIMSAPKPAPVKPVPMSVKPQTPPAPSLILLGMEMRGGERLLSIVPQKTPSLANVRLVRVGETIEGWVLRSFDEREAVFEKKGQTHKLALP